MIIFQCFILFKWSRAKLWKRCFVQQLSSLHYAEVVVFKIALAVSNMMWLSRNHSLNFLRIQPSIYVSSYSHMLLFWTLCIYIWNIEESIGEEDDNTLIRVGVHSMHMDAYVYIHKLYMYVLRIYVCLHACMYIWTYIHSLILKPTLYLQINMSKGRKSLSLLVCYIPLP